MKNTGKIIALSLAIAALLLSCEKKSDDTNPTPLIEWTWVAGNDKVDQAGTYGTKGTPAATNVPGAREDAASWIGADGRFWLFGGYAYDSTGYPGRANDLWAYDTAATTWTWVSGSDVRNQAGNYGTLGVADPANVPGARNGAVSWVDAVGRLWLFGGLGLDSTGEIGQMNDLWRFEPATDEWTWVSGSSIRYQPGVYGTLGAADPANIPGARVGSTGWIDGSGGLWLFGGLGYDAAGDKGRLNDLWRYEPTTGHWVWISGSDTMEVYGTYGTKGTAAAENVPGSRTMALSWADGDGPFWIYGGSGLGNVDAESEGRLNDLWKYDPAASQWTWVSGSFLANISGNYGTQATSSVDYYPGGRYGAIRWIDADGLLWLFGGYAMDSAGGEGWLNDLWKFNPLTLEWMWVSGSNYHGQGGAYGTKGTASTSNVPGARYFGTGWLDSTGRRWIFGGYGLDSATAGGRLNDLWR